MAGINQVGTCSYNGWTFPPAIKARINIQPQPDPSGRAAKYNVYTIRIECWVHKGMDANFTTLTAGINYLRKKLTPYGKPLSYTDKVLGTFDFNNGGAYDLAYGPKPVGLEIIPGIEGQTAKIVWTCEVATTDCESTVGDFLSYTLEETWSIREGITTRTIAGQFEIPARSNSGVPTDQADAYRNLIDIALPDDCKRTQSYHLSPDGRTLHFTIIDEQIDSYNPFPLGVVAADATYDVSNVDKGFRTWLCSLSATYKVSAEANMSLAWAAFQELRDSKVNAATNAEIDGDDTPAGYVITTNFKATEHPYSRVVGFSTSWLLMTDLATLFAGSGLFAPINHNTWAAWQASIADAHSERGHAGMGTDLNDRTIITYCDGNETLPPYSGTGDQETDSSTASAYTLADCPTAEKSWITLDIDVELIHEYNAVIFQRAAPAETLGATAHVPSTTTDLYNGGSQATTVRPKLYRRNPSTYLVKMTVKGVRAYYPVPMFTLAAYAGQTPELYERIPARNRILSGYKCKVYASYQESYWFLPQPPNGYSLTTAMDPEVDTFKRD